MKITNSFTHALELVADSKKNIVCTLITGFDSGSVAIISAILYFIEKDEEKVLKVWFWVGIFAVVLYFIFIPESPRFLFMTKKPKQAIAVLNYIAWLNLSNFRIPEDAQFDSIGQAINETQTLNQTGIGRSRIH